MAQRRLKNRTGWKGRMAATVIRNTTPSHVLINVFMCRIYERKTMTSHTLPNPSAWASIKYTKIMLDHLCLTFDVVLVSLKCCLLFDTKLLDALWGLVGTPSGGLLRLPNSQTHSTLPQHENNAPIFSPSADYFLSPNYQVRQGHLCTATPRQAQHSPKLTWLDWHKLISALEETFWSVSTLSINIDIINIHIVIETAS